MLLFSDLHGQYIQPECQNGIHHGLDHEQIEASKKINYVFEQIIKDQPAFRSTLDRKAEIDCVLKDASLSQSLREEYVAELNALKSEIKLILQNYTN